MKNVKVVCFLFLVCLLMTEMLQAGIPIGDPNAGNGWDTTSAVSVKASHRYHPADTSREWVNIINGSGLYEDVNGVLVHDIFPDEMTWCLMVYPTNPDDPNYDPINVLPVTRPGLINDGIYGDRWFVFEFDQIYPLESVDIWGYNEAGQWAWAAFSLKDVCIQVSLTGGTDPAEWTVLSKTSWEFNSPGATTQNAATPEKIILGGITAKYVAFVLKNGNEGTYINNIGTAAAGAAAHAFGLSEVRFYASDPQYCGDLGTTYLAMDFNKDCRVDFSDFAEFVEQWLSCSDPADSACDTYWK